jgi:hypothetical protein
VVQKAVGDEIGSSAQFASCAQANAGASGSLIGGFSLNSANDSRLRERLEPLWFRGNRLV